MKDIILIDNALYSARKQEMGLRQGFKGYPHLGLAYLAGVLRKNSVDFEVWDLSFDSLKTDIIKKSKYVGLTAMTHNVLEAFRIAREIKKINPKIQTILGGVHGTALPVKTLEECESVDIIVKGEGELTLLDILNSNSLNNIKGISYRKNGNFIDNPPRPTITNLDTIPFPAWDVFDLNKYMAFRFYNNDLKAYVTQGFILGSRGCIYPCSFCYRFMGEDATHVRFRSIENIEAEIRYLMDKFKINYIGFTDASMVMNKDLFYKLMDLIKKLDIYWNGIFRVNEITEEVLQKIDGTKIDFIGLGVESLSDKQLKNMNKKLTYKTLLTAVSLLKKYNHKIFMSFIAGYPGETEETLRTTYKRAIELNVDSIGINMADPYPGTELYKMLISSKTPYRFKDGKESLWNSFNRNDILIESPLISDSILRKYFIKFEVNYRFHKIESMLDFFSFARYYLIRFFKIRTPGFFRLLYKTKLIFAK